MIIGLSGKLGSGKDTVADIISDYILIERKSFAYKVKQITAILTGTTIEQNLTREGKNIFIPAWKMTLGEMQQKVGTECIRDTLNQDAWVIALFADINNDGRHYVITDARFENEANAIKMRGGILIRINGDPANIRRDSTRDLNHPSETSLDSYPHFDYVIDNNGTIEDLKSQVISILMSVGLI